jgi:carboxyl-terminal processing protease
MNSRRATSITRFVLVATILLVALAGCNSTGIPNDVPPGAFVTPTPERVAAAPTATLEEFMPGATPTPGAGGGAPARTSTPRRPRATSTPEAARPTEEQTEEATQEPTQEPTEEPTAVSGGEPLPTILPLADRLDLFEEVWDTINEKYLYRDFRGVDWDAVHDSYEPLVRTANTSTEFYTALGDMVGELNDNHSRFLSPKERQEEDDLQGGNANYVGVGIISSPAEQSVVVVFVFPSSPAEKAGLKRRDRIVGIDGQPVDDPLNISNRIRGEEGTTVRLSVRSPGQPEREVPIVRGKISGAVVPTSSRLETDDSIGYLIIPDLWTVDMGDRVEVELERLLNGSPKLEGLVIDLRGNGGGFRTVLQQILGFFISGRIGFFFDSTGSYPFEISATSPLLKSLEDVPVVVLVDGGTVSYAEVLAAAVQEKGRAQVVGVHSEGNTETIYQYNFFDDSRLWCAQEGFELLDGTNLEGRGVEPDFIIDEDWTAYPERDDPHILKAVELLTSQ